MTRTVDQELVVLMTDQELTLTDSLAGLRAWLDRGRSVPGERWRVTLVDNGSTDATARIGQHFADSVDDVDFVGLPAHLGRGDLRARWANSSARTVAFLELSPGANFDVLLGPALEHAGCDGRTKAVDRFSLRGLVDRRTALGTIGGLGLVAFVTACTGSSSSTAKASTPPSTRLAPSSTSSSSFRRGQSSPTTTVAQRRVGLAPEIIEGPYYLDLNKVRSDITEDRRGVALALNLMVVDAATGGPIKGAAVDVWHADAEGLYSGFVKTSAGVNKQTAVSADDGTFLRGTQLSDRLGRVAFATIYPGWYSGRAVHIHVKVHADGAVIHTGQLYFDDALTDKVFASVAPYASRAKRDVRNATDSFYGAPGRMSTLAVSKKGDGYTTAMTLGMKST